MLDNLTLDQMRIFDAVAETGSFRSAAQKLHRVQSAISYAIGMLEQQLGVALFDRTAYRPALTPAGRSLLSEVKVILGQVDGLKARARELQEGVELQLSLAVDTLFAPDTVADALKRMHAGFPNVEVRVEATSLGGTLDALLSGRCAMALIALDRPDDRIARSYLMPVVTEAVVAPFHPLARLRDGNQDIWQQAFREHLQIVVEDPTDLTKERSYGVLSPRTWRVSDMVTKLAMLRTGLGWGSMPEWLVAADLSAGTLVNLPAAALGPRGRVTYHAYFCHRSGEALGPAARCLRDAFIDIASPLVPELLEVPE